MNIETAHWVQQSDYVREFGSTRDFWQHITWFNSHFVYVLQFNIFSYLENRFVDNKAMAPTFYVGSEAGLKKLDEYLLSRSYITGWAS